MTDSNKPIMSKHTLGPWSVSDGLSTRRLVADVQDGHQGLKRWAVVHDGKTEGDAQADARLIAAAPELLEACEQAIGVLTEPGVMGVDEWKAWQKRTIVAARAAVEKAKP